MEMDGDGWRWMEMERCDDGEMVKEHKSYRMYIHNNRTLYRTRVTPYTMALQW